MESLVNPVQHVPRPKISTGRTRRLEGDEEERLLGACCENIRHVIKFAVETAMRRGEIASIEWKHVDLDNRAVYLPRTKNESERIVLLSPAAISILKELENAKADGLVFGMSAIAITHAYIKACKRAGIEELAFHDLRHEATSRLFENTNLDVMEIKSITGHRSIQMLARYSHLRTHRLTDRLAGTKRGSESKGS